MRSSVRVWGVVAVVVASPASWAQPQRPLQPEPACTRVSLQLRPAAGARAMGLRVVNDDPGDFTARLRPEVEVQQLVHGGWRRVSAAGLQLRSSCREDVRSCVTLAPRAALEVVPWSGMVGDAQCECTRCAPAPAGTYRFVVHTCEACLAPHSAESPTFALAATAGR